MLAEQPSEFLWTIGRFDRVGHSLFPATFRDKTKFHESPSSCRPEDYRFPHAIDRNYIRSIQDYVTQGADGKYDPVVCNGHYVDAPYGHEKHEESKGHGST